jgi:hypothetical protein
MPPKCHAPQETLTKQTRKDDPEQSKAFIKKAREIEADEKRSAADKLMERLAKTPPQKRGNRSDE